MKIKFDIKALGQDLKLQRKSKKKSLRAAAREMKLNHAVVHRLENNKQDDIHTKTLVSICGWINTDPDIYFKSVRK